MAEHADRYKGLAEYLAAHGISSYLYDQRGHGHSAPDGLGRVPVNGWDAYLEDLGRVLAEVEQTARGLPIFLLGHSMGSFLVRDFSHRESRRIRGVILSGTAVQDRFLISLGSLLSTVRNRFVPREKPSPLLNGLSLGPYNKAFRPNRTKYDWISSVESEVDSYAADPFCGFVPSGGFFKELFRGISRIDHPSRLDSLPTDLPVFLFSGESDPVGGMGARVRRLYDAYRRAGANDVSMKLYPRARHEVLHDWCAEEAAHDIVSWLEHHS
jgi:alpha-beta hydrolase superfamily lysophospholipase